jgi:hypothetical protein
MSTFARTNYIYISALYELSIQSYLKDPSKTFSNKFRTEIDIQTKILEKCFFEIIELSTEIEVRKLVHRVFIYVECLHSRFHS